MVYYVKNEKGMVIGYATRKDALLAILSMPSMRYDLRMECAYKDRGCRNRAFTVQRITANIYNFYKGSKLSWDGDRNPQEVTKDGTLRSAFKKY